MTRGDITLPFVVGSATAFPLGEVMVNGSNYSITTLDNSGSLITITTAGTYDFRYMAEFSLGLGTIDHVIALGLGPPSGITFATFLVGSIFAIPQTAEVAALDAVWGESVHTLSAGAQVALVNLSGAPVTIVNDGGFLVYQSRTRTFLHITKEAPPAI